MSIRIVGDIGGTNARFALRGPAGTLTNFRTWTTTELLDLAATLNRYQQSIDIEASEAVIAVAGPVHADVVELTNSGLKFSQQKLSNSLGLRKLAVINDLEALALGVPNLEAADLQSIGPPAAPHSSAPRVVLGVGTGFGVAGLVHSVERWLAIGGEGGHSDFAPANKREAELLALLAPRFGDHLSWERLLCGPGLEELHKALAELDGRPRPELSAAQIADNARREPDSHCRSSVDQMFALLASAAGNLALIYGAFGGVYIGGGVATKLLDLANREAFTERFINKGRFASYLSRVPVSVILRPDTARLGAANYHAPTPP